MANNTELNYLYQRILISELIEKTNRCGVSWDQLSSGVFKTDFTWNNNDYDVYFTLLPQSVYILDFIKFGVNFISFNSTIDDQLDDLYHAIVDGIEKRLLQEIIQDISSLRTCENFIDEFPHGGAKISGTALYSKVKIVEVGDGGLFLGGSANVTNPIVISGKAFVSGYSNVTSTYFKSGSSGSIVAGDADVKPYFEFGSGGARISGHAILPVDVYLGGLVNYVGKIERLNPDGSLTLIQNDVGSVADLEVDLTNNKIFWLSGYIYSCNLDGSNLTTVINPENAAGIALDRTNQIIFYARRSYIASRVDIRRCNYDGTGDTLVVRSPVNLIMDFGLYGTITNGHLFWTATEAAPGGASTSMLYTCDADGNNLYEVFSQTAINFLFGINTGAIDYFDGGTFENSSFCISGTQGLYKTAVGFGGMALVSNTKTGGKIAISGEDVYLPASTVSNVIRTNFTQSEVLLSPGRSAIAIGKR